ncbi:MAG: AbrB/MazE/SpoVT family DNA-binding domain-containing protein [Acidithiobacillus sp.]
MRVIVRKWGNGASIRILTGIMESAHLCLDDPVDIREEGGRIIIESIGINECDLAQPLAGMTPENLHAEVDFAVPAGKELL